MQPGDQIDGKYEVEGVLGQGGMGLVVAARDLVLGHRVAIKVLKEGLDDETIRRRFLREARGAGQLRHPHIARMIDFGLLPDDRPYLVMELLDGPDLQTVLDQRPLTPALACSYVRQACEGLAEAHAHGIVHRDVKPANLMLSRESHGTPIVKVVDFGIATAAARDRDDSQLTGLHMVIGSVSYMSPEQLRSSHEIDHRSDVWSLGVTLYELVSGRVPFPGDTWAAIACAISTDPHDTLDDLDLDPRLVEIINRCLEKDPANRVASAKDLGAALASLDRASVPSPLALFEAIPNLHIFQLDTTPPRPRVWPRFVAAAALVVGIALIGVTAARTTPWPAITVPVRSRPTAIVTPIVRPAPPRVIAPVENASTEPEPEPELEIELAPEQMTIRKPARAKPRKPARIARAGCNPRLPRCR